MVVTYEGTVCNIPNWWFVFPFHFFDYHSPSVGAFHHPFTYCSCKIRINYCIGAVKYLHRENILPNSEGSK